MCQNSSAFHKRGRRLRPLSFPVIETRGQEGKKEATPGNKEYGDMMRRVLDDGMNEAAAAEVRYLRMSREK